MHLRDIFVAYDIRRGIFDNLSAFDIAKLDLCLGRLLDPVERLQYLKPARDLFWNVTSMESLLKKGMRLILLGKDGELLWRRIEDPAAYKHKRKLQVFLVGAFPFSREYSPSAERMISFTVTRNPCERRLGRDHLDFQKMRRRISRHYDSERLFLMSFGAESTDHREKCGFWCKVPDVPDSMIELKVYVPCMADRRYEEVVVPFSELVLLSGTRRSYVRMMYELLFRSKIFHLPILEPYVPGQMRTCQARSCLTIVFPLGVCIEIM